MMKASLIYFFISLLAGASGFAQHQGPGPVKWRYSATKLDDKTWEIHLTASIDKGWHIYSQYQPKEAIAIPTKIRISKNPLIVSCGQINEVGNKEKQTIKELDIVQFQYTDQVDFVQRVILKANVQTSIAGTVTFQVCTDEQCLPPKEEAFSLSL